MSARGMLLPYTAWMFTLTVLNFALPSEHVFLWTAIGISSVVAILLGIRLNRPRRRGPWYLFAAAVFCLAIGDLSADILIRVFNQPDPFPSIGDWLYLTMYVLVALGMVWLYRLGVVQRDISGILDALTLTTGVTLLAWVYLIGPYVNNPQLTGLEKAISIGYPLGDILILAIGASLVASVRTTPAVWLFALGGIGLLASDIAYGLIQLHGTWATGTPVDLGWIIYYACWGAAALHPSMRELTEPKVLPNRERPRRLILLALACLIAPVVLLVEVLTGDVHDGAIIAVLSATLSVLVLVRLGRALLVQRRAVDRERALREAGASLLLATDETGVSTVVTGAVARLLPPREPHRVLLANGAQDEKPATMKMAYTSTLDPSITHDLGDFEVTLCCPLAASGWAGGQGGLGELYVAADEAVLVSLQDAAQVLASQAAMAIERIMLSAEIDRQNSDAYFRTLVLNTADVILIVDDDDRIRYASPSANMLFRSDPTGQAMSDVVDAESVHEVRWRLERIRAGQPDHIGHDWRVPLPEGAAARVEASVRDLRAEPTVAGLVVTLRNVTESRHMQQELYRQATLDALTGLSNREVFVESAQRMLEQSRRGAIIGCVLVAELDDFKMVNNTMGHSAGDDVLVAVGARLRVAIERLTAEWAERGEVDPSAQSDRPVARLGGDEFAACVAVATQSHVDEAVAAISSCFVEPYVLGQSAVALTASIGVATTEAERPDQAQTVQVPPPGRADAQELLRQSDLAVYVAKDAGKGRALQYEASLHGAVIDRVNLRNDLEQAIAEGAFELVHQPIADLNDGATVGFEALVRWRHPLRGPLSPAEFIGLAEESGLIVPLGAWVLRHAIEAAAHWSRLRPRLPPYVSVNVSPRQLRAPGFVESVRAELGRAGMPPAALTLEVTEGMLVRERIVADVLAALRVDGVRIAIDDFGTGFSSLSYLRQLPVDVIKLDKSFVDTVTSSKEQYAVMTAITQLARALDLDIVAEGIETDEELTVLATLGCGYGQGYLLSPPISYGETVTWLRDNAPAPVTTGRSR